MRFVPTWTLAELEHFRKEIYVKEGDRMDEAELKKKFEL
jgi:hypothetical protein